MTILERRIIEQKIVNEKFKNIIDYLNSHNANFLETNLSDEYEFLVYADFHSEDEDNFWQIYFYIDQDMIPHVSFHSMGAIPHVKKIIAFLEQNV